MQEQIVVSHVLRWEVHMGAHGRWWALRGGGGFREEAMPLRSLQGGEGNSQATKQEERDCSNGDDADSQEY